MCSLYYKLYLLSSHIPVLIDSKVPGTHSHTPSIGSQNALSSRHFVSAVQFSPKPRPERNAHEMPCVTDDHFSKHGLELKKDKRKRKKMFHFAQCFVSFSKKRLICSVFLKPERETDVNTPFIGNK